MRDKKRPICENCDYPLLTCLCAHITQQILPIKITIIQHAKEAKHAKNTVKIARLVSPSIEVISHCDADGIRRLQNVMDVKTTIILYPTEYSIPLDGISIINHNTCLLRGENKHKRVERLVFIDGNWKQAYGIRQSNKWLNSYIHCHFGKMYNKKYSIRKSKKDDQLSTIEAIAYSLNMLSGIATDVYLMPFMHMQEKWNSFKQIQTES